MTSPPTPGQHNHAAETAAAAWKRIERRFRGADEADLNDFAIVEQALAAAEARLAETERQRDEALAWQEQWKRTAEFHERSWREACEQLRAFETTTLAETMRALETSEQQRDEAREMRDRQQQITRSEMARSDEYQQAYRLAEADLAKERIGHAGQKRLAEGERIRADRAVASAARAEEALRQYGSHRTSCAYPDCGACDCGFATALSTGAETTPECDACGASMKPNDPRLPERLATAAEVQRGPRHGQHAIADLLTEASWALKRAETARAALSAGAEGTAGEGVKG